MCVCVCVYVGTRLNSNSNHNSNCTKSTTALRNTLLSRVLQSGKIYVALHATLNRSPRSSSGPLKSRLKYQKLQFDFAAPAPGTRRIDWLSFVCRFGVLFLHRAFAVSVCGYDRDHSFEQVLLMNASPSRPSLPNTVRATNFREAVSSIVDRGRRPLVLLSSVPALNLFWN